MILNPIAILLFVLVAFSTINFWIVIFNYKKEVGFWKTVNGYFNSSAKELDIFANRYFRALWNAFFSKGGYAFGKVGETLSSALGKKQKEKSLTIFGWIMVGILFIIDYKNWKNGGHCIASIK